MTVRMRHNRSQKNQRRSHDALKGGALTSCNECKKPVLRHTMCKTCGKYRGKKVVDVFAKIAKKDKKKKEAAKAS